MESVQSLQQAYLFEHTLRNEFLYQLETVLLSTLKIEKMGGKPLEYLLGGGNKSTIHR